MFSGYIDPQFAHTLIRQHHKELLAEAAHDRLVSEALFHLAGQRESGARRFRILKRERPDV